MATYSNTWVWPEAWATRLQEELDEPTVWKDVCNVEYTDVKVLNNPYLTDPTVQSLTRGTSYTMQPVTETNESVSIDLAVGAHSFIDRADLAQSKLLGITELAQRQAVLLNEKIETAFMGDHASLTDFGTSSIGAGGAATDQITVTDTNIIDIITGLTREIGEANGLGMFYKNGGFIIWRHADFEKLTAFALANGYNLADYYLANGVKVGVNYAGFTHFASNFHTANHVIAGVKKLYHMGILRSTYGETVITQDPENTSGVGVNSRIDYRGKAWTRSVSVLFDVNVA